MMFLRFLSKQHLLKGLILFVGTLGLAIAIAHNLTQTELRSATNPGLSMPIATGQSATSSLQVENRYDRRLAHYATVSRSDGSFRQIFIEENSIAAIQPEEPLSDGTLIVMETWYSPETVGTVFVKQKQDGEWQYGSFNPSQPNYQMQFSRSCHRCHAPFPETDFTLTKPLLEAALQTQQVQAAYCDRAGRTPCEPETYVPAS